MRTASLTVIALVAFFCAPQAGIGGRGRAAPSPKLSKVLDDYYSPFRISVAGGGSVKWVWPATNLHPHNLKLFKAPTGVNKKEYRSPTRVRRFSFQREFPKPGDYEFLCTLHPFTMRQTVSVRR